MVGRTFNFNMEKENAWPLFSVRRVLKQLTSTFPFTVTMNVHTAGDTSAFQSRVVNACPSKKCLLRNSSYLQVGSSSSFQQRWWLFHFSQHF